MRDRRNSNTEHDSFIEIFEDTRRNIDNDWPEWKKNITPFESTSTTLTTTTRTSHYSHSRNSEEDSF